VGKNVGCAVVGRRRIVLRQERKMRRRCIVFLRWDAG